MEIGNIVLGVVTIIGTLFGVISVIDARKSRKELDKFTYLFNIAERNIDKSSTQEEIDRLHQEKKDMKKTLDDLEKTIKQDIPKQARKTVLYDRLKADEEYLSISYNRYKETKSEYERLAMATSTEMPQTIMSEIEAQIMPEYLIKTKRQRYMSMLTIISYATALLSALPIVSSFSRYAILFTLYPIIRLIGLNMPIDKHERRKYIFNIFVNILIIILFILNVFLLLSINDYWGTVFDIQFTISITGPIMILLIGYKAFTFFKNKSKK